MKFLSRILTVVAMAAALLMAPAVQAASTRTFAGTGTDVSTNLCYYIASANYAGIPRVQYINATSDLTSSAITFYSTATPLLVTTAQSIATNIITAVGTTFSGSDVVIVRHVSTDTYERAVVSSANGTTITLSANLSAIAAVGDLVYKCTAAGSIPVGNTTKELNAGVGGIYNGVAGRPLLVEVNGTSACQVNCVSGIYQE